MKQLRNVLLAVAFIGNLLWLLATPARAEAADGSYLAKWLEQPSLQFGAVEVKTPVLRAYYAGHGYQPVWVDGNGLTPKANAALEVIGNADMQGLNPELYAVTTIRRVNAMLRRDMDEAAAMQVRMSLELLVSHAVMEYAADMSTGNARPQWKTGKESIATDETLLEQALANANPAAYLMGLEPTTAEYKGLKMALAQYQQLAANDAWPAFASGKTIKPGMKDERIATLRQILVAGGDMVAAADLPADTYDSVTEAGVKHFQERHGIEPDGILGAGTQAELAVPLARRIEQIAMTMERMRWMPGSLGTRYVLVNIPAYQLTAVAGENQLKMNVIVGKSNSPTPMFSKNITDVVLNPSWSVPPKIALNEMLPKVRKDPEYLTRAGYKVVEYSSNQAVDPLSIDWDSVGHGNFAFSFRQQPGDDNALGKVKFNIPDSDNIYLHDTSQRALFVKAERSLSHGCVRLGDPKALTQFILGNEGWSEAKIDAAYEGDASRTVRITPIPVHLVYWTSWVTEDGSVHFGRDIYGKDKQLLAAMGTPNREDSLKLAMN